MSIISKSTIYDFGTSSRQFSTTLNESLLRYSNDSKIGKKTVFLSHKHNELRELEGVIAFLKKMKIDVYIDWLDVDMPRITSGMTAQLLKEKIRTNDRFIFLATEGAISSKWCNWELGYGDYCKYSENLAVFPVRDDHNSYTGSEYLQIYSRIERVESNTIERKIGGHFDQGYYVISPPNVNGVSTYTKIQDWLSK